MATSYKVLGQQNPAATTATTHVDHCLILSACSCGGNRGSSSATATATTITPITDSPIDTTIIASIIITTLVVIVVAIITIVITFTISATDVVATAGRVHLDPMHDLPRALPLGDAIVPAGSRRL